MMLPAISPNVENLVAGIERLSLAELAAFSDGFEEYLADVWDQQIEADILAGRLDAAGQKAEEEFNPQKCSPL